MPNANETGPKRQGRPPKGEGGSRIQDYPRQTLRLPPVTAARLKAWADISGVPMWRLIADSIEAQLAQLTGEDAKDVQRLARRYVSRLRGEG